MEWIKGNAKNRPIFTIYLLVFIFRFQNQVLKPKKKKSKLAAMTLHTPFVLLILFQLEMAYLFWLAYGTLAFILGPLRTWSVFLAIALWYQSLTYPSNCTRFVKIDENLKELIFNTIF